MLTQPSMMRLFFLEPYEDKIQEFSRLGRNNFSSSLEKEEGTLFMACAYEKDNPAKKIVFELYEDVAAYQTHAASQHFKTFASFAKDNLKERRVVELAPQILVEKHGDKAFLSEVAVDMRLARLKVDLAHAKAFEAIVAREMKTAVAVEDGVLSLMAARDVSDLSTWYFFEVYSSQEAYDLHRETAHFKDYITESLELVSQKSLFPLSAELLVSKGGISFEGGLHEA